MKKLIILLLAVVLISGCVAPVSETTSKLAKDVVLSATDVDPAYTYVAEASGPDTSIVQSRKWLYDLGVTDGYVVAYTAPYNVNVIYSYAYKITQDNNVAVFDASKKLVEKNIIKTNFTVGDASFVHYLPEINGFALDFVEKDFYAGVVIQGARRLPEQILIDYANKMIGKMG